MYAEELLESLIWRMLGEKSYQKQSVMLLFNPIVLLPLLSRSHLTYTWKDKYDCHYFPRNSSAATYLLIFNP